MHCASERDVGPVAATPWGRAGVPGGSGRGGRLTLYFQGRGSHQVHPRAPARPLNHPPGRAALVQRRARAEANQERHRAAVGCVVQSGWWCVCCACVCVCVHAWGIEGWRVGGRRGRSCRDRLWGCAQEGRLRAGAAHLHLHGPPPNLRPGAFSHRPSAVARLHACVLAHAQAARTARCCSGTWRTAACRSRALRVAPCSCAHRLARRTSTRPASARWTGRPPLARSSWAPTTATWWSSRRPPT
jgi:hypothetical protein